MRGRQDHCDAYVDDLTISCQADLSKVVEDKARWPRKSNTPFFTTNVVHRWRRERPRPTIRGVVKPSSRSLENLWAAVFDNNTTSNNGHLVPNGRAPHLKNSLWPVALPPECKKKITNHLARKTVVAKLKKAG